MAEQDRKPPARRSRQLRPGHDRCGRCLLHGVPPPNGPNRATLLGQVWVALSPKVAVQTFLREGMEYRFNRRYDLAAMIPRVCWAGVRTAPMPYQFLKLAEVYA
jgi:hypothetical protein